MWRFLLIYPHVGLHLKYIVAMVIIVEVCCCHEHYRLQFTLAALFLSPFGFKSLLVLSPRDYLLQVSQVYSTVITEGLLTCW